MNALSSDAENADRQPYPKLYSPPPKDPLKQAAIANGSLKINLRQFRRDLNGPTKLSAVNRLLDASEAIARSLEWLAGNPKATNDNLERLAIESHAMPGAVEAVAK